MNYFTAMVAFFLIPVVMVICGMSYTKRAPKRISKLAGFRTKMSMKNRDTWEFAHKYMGKLWFRLGWLLIPFSVIPMLFVIGKGEDIVATVGMVVMVIDLIVLIAPIFPTEKALKKTFDKDGNRKAE